MALNKIKRMVETSNFWSALICIDRNERKIVLGQFSKLPVYRDEEQVLAAIQAQTICVFIPREDTIYSTLERALFQRPNARVILVGTTGWYTQATLWTRDKLNELDGSFVQFFEV